MIKSAHIQNFQSHKDTTLEFSKGVNIIVGSTDAGKTAILRALYLCATNKPNGDDFCSDWGGETKVDLSTNDFLVSRIKDKSKNLYKLTDKNGVEINFAAFGANIPKEVETALNLSESSLQRQLDPPFLLSNTSGQVASHFNKIANLEIIDTVTQKIKKEIKAIGSSIDFKEKDLEKNETIILPKYNFIQKFEIDLEVLEEMEKEVNKNYSSINSINISVSKLILLTSEIAAVNILASNEKEVDRLLEVFKDQEQVLEKQEALLSVIAEIEDAENDLKYYLEKIQHEKEVNKLLALYEEIKIQQTIWIELDDLVTRIFKNDSVIFMEKMELHKKQTLFKKEMPNICPLCDTNLKRK